MIFYDFFFTWKVLGRIFRFFIFRFIYIIKHTLMLLVLPIYEFSWRFFRINRFIMIIVSLNWQIPARNFIFRSILRGLLSCSVILFILITLLLGECIYWYRTIIIIFSLRKWQTLSLFSINIHFDLFVSIRSWPLWSSLFRWIYRGWDIMIF
jgi:hypothetical protein